MDRSCDQISVVTSIALRRSAGQIQVSEIPRTVNAFRSVSLKLSRSARYFKAFAGMGREAKDFAQEVAEERKPGARRGTR